MSEHSATVVSTSLRALCGRMFLSVLLLVAGGCTTTASLVLGVAGVATDTSIPWAVTKHLYAKATEGDPISCSKLNSVQRALSARCGPFEAGSLDAKDVADADLQECPLSLAARDPQLWPVLPELIAKGARTDSCNRTPWAALAQAQPCPDFAAASEAERRSLAWLATSDPRAVQHDVVRVLSCPSARTAGLDKVLDGWWLDGRLAPARLPFGMLGALHPDALNTPLAQALEQEGHTAKAALRVHPHGLPTGFEEALRTGNWAALNWWFKRMPDLANRIPPTAAGQLAWSPLARVLAPSFLADSEDQKAVVGFLLARGADPYRAVAFNPGMTIAAYARSIDSPVASMLDRPPLQVLQAKREAAAPEALSLAR